MIFIASISITLFVSALLLNKKNKSRADIILLIWMCILAVHIYLFSINFDQSIFQVPFLLGIDIPMPLLHGVFLYLYISSITNQFPKKNWYIVIHLLPALISYIYLFSFFKLKPAQKVFIFKNHGIGYETFLSTGLILIFLSGIVYVLWSIYLLRNYKRNIQDNYSNIEKIDLKWLHLLTYGLGFIWLIIIFTNNDLYIFTSTSFFVTLIGFFGLQQKTVFINQKPFEIEANKIKYQRSGLTAEMIEVSYKNLMQKLTSEALYKKENLSLPELASELSISSNQLSQIINERLETNFYDFINTFRVNEFKRQIQIQKDKQYTLLAIAFDCGFNSKSSFNRSFKKQTGQTPSEYIKSLSSKT